MGAGSWSKAGPGTLILSGAQKTYAGGTTINGGTLQMGAENVLPNGGAAAVNGGTFALNGFGQTIGDFSGSRATTLGSAVLTIQRARLPIPASSLAREG